MEPMRWYVSDRFDPRARRIADRHYNRQKVGSPQFVPPGRCLVLVTAEADAFWVTSWPFAQYVRHAWAGAFVCSAFRNEGPVLSSVLVAQAVEATVAHFQAWPAQGFVTFVDAEKVRPKRDPGRCYRRAGWQPAGHTKGGLVALCLQEPPQAPRPALRPMPLLDLAEATA